MLESELCAQGAEIKAKWTSTIHFEIEEQRFYPLHLGIRTASNLFQQLRECSAKSSKILYSQAGRIKWTQLLRSDKTIRIDVEVSPDGASLSPQECGKEVFCAIDEQFRFKKIPRPEVAKKDPDLKILVYLRNNRARISLCSGGQALHKRGWRQKGHPAPLKETTAAGILHYCGYHGQMPLFDPMAGSGTIAIEGAYLALGKSALIHRKKDRFGFEAWKTFDRNLWRRSSDEARNARRAELDSPIFGWDINSSYTEVAHHSAIKARVDRFIDFRTENFFTAEPPAPSGLLVCNLPYGERITGSVASDGDDGSDFFRKFGQKIRESYADWQVAVLVPKEIPPSCFRSESPSLSIRLPSGSLDTKLLMWQRPAR